MDAPARTVETVEDYEAAHARASIPLLVQIGSPACERCPAFAEEIAKLAHTHQFVWVYCNAHADDQELTEHFTIAQLPAFVLKKGCDDPLVVANATLDQLRDAVGAGCTPVLTLDADF